MYLLLFRGMFWRIGSLLQKPSGPAARARVAVVIPARDESDVIGQAVASIRAQQFDGEIIIFVTDDNSSDATAEIAAAQGATVIQAGPLPPGWTGKLWAAEQGVKAAARTDPDYLLLTDADIVHGSTSIRDLIARNVPLASVMVKLRCDSLPEQLLIPPFVFFFFKLYPPMWIADPRAKTAGAAGGCILIRREMLDKIGGIEAIRNELIDDCALARAVKTHGPIWLGMSSDTQSIRPYATFGPIWNMVARTAFTQLRHSPVVLVGAIAGMFFTYLAPPIATLTGSWIGALTWIAMAAAYAPMTRFYGQPIIASFLLPVAALFYSGATIHSAIRYWLGAGGQWKGRVQDQKSNQ